MTNQFDEDKYRWMRQSENEWRMLRYKGRSPQDIMELGNHNPVIDSCVKAWRNGQMSWEQALTEMVVHLAPVYERLMELSVNVEMVRPVEIRITDIRKGEEE